MNQVCLQEMAHEELQKILKQPATKKRRLLIQGYRSEDKTLHAKLYLDAKLPMDIHYGAFKNQLKAEEFIRHLKKYSLHTDLQVMQLSPLNRP